MPRANKRRRLYKQQSRTSDGKFGPKKKNKQLPSQNKLINSEETDDNIYGEFNDANEWGDDDDSGWEDEIDFEKEKNIQLKLLRKGLGKLNNYFTVIVFFLLIIHIYFRVGCG